MSFMYRVDTQYTPQHTVQPYCSSFFMLDQQNFDIGSGSAASPHDEMIKLCSWNRNVIAARHINHFEFNKHLEKFLSHHIRNGKKLKT